MAVGGKPYVMSESECKGFHHAITSDDIFFLKEQPKKVLVLGGGYIASECASFLSKLGTKVILMNRSRPLRKYDRQIADYLLEKFEEDGWEIINGAKPTSIVKEADGTLTVTYYDEDLKQSVTIDKVDQVLSAISRVPNVQNLNLKAIPAIKQAKDGKLLGGFNGEYDRLSDSIYAVGDCLAGVPELTPIAIKGGRHLADKLDSEASGITDAKSDVDTKFYPSTVFTWPEYSFCGYSEEEAIKKFGAEHVICYHSRSVLLESALDTEHQTKTYVKIVTVRQEDGSNKIMGMHYVGANAGEVMQGFAVG